MSKTIVGRDDESEVPTIESVDVGEDGDIRWSTTGPDEDRGDGSRTVRAAQASWVARDRRCGDVTKTSQETPTPTPTSYCPPVRVVTSKVPRSEVREAPVGCFSDVTPMSQTVRH